MTREEAIRIFRKEIECLSHTKCEDCILEKACDPMNTTPYDSEYIEAYSMAIKALEQEPKTGHWYDKWGKDGCSVCNEGIDDAQTFDGRPFRYCPMCGAKMKGGE